MPELMRLIRRGKCWFGGELGTPIEFCLKRPNRRAGLNSSGLRESWGDSLTYAKSGRHVTRSEIDRLIKKPFYAGDFTWSGTFYHGDHPALVDRELLDRVQEAFKRRSNGKLGTRVFTFSRLMTCATCGYTITAEIKKGKHVYYHCTGYGNKHKVLCVPEREIDAQFAQIVKAVTLPWEWYEYVKESLEREWGDRKAAMGAQRKRLTRSRDQIMADMKKAYQDSLHDRIPQDFFQTVHQDQQRRLNEVKFQLSSLPDSTEKQFDLARMAIELSHQAESLYLRANREQKRKLLKSVLSNCELDGPTLRPVYGTAFELLAKGIATKDKRRGRDSNPGVGFPTNCLAGSCLRPLGHPSCELRRAQARRG